MNWAFDSVSKLIKPTASGSILLPCAGLGDVTCNEDALCGPAGKISYDLCRVLKQLSFYVVMEVNRMITFLPKVNI